MEVPRLGAEAFCYSRLGPASLQGRRPSPLSLLYHKETIGLPPGETPECAAYFHAYGPRSDQFLLAFHQFRRAVRSARAEFLLDAEELVVFCDAVGPGC